MSDISACEAARVVLAQSAVSSLFADQPLGCMNKCRIAGRGAGSTQTFDHVKYGVGEIDSPETHPGAIGLLAVAKEMNTAIDRGADFLNQQCRVRRMLIGQSAEARTG